MLLPEFDLRRPKVSLYQAGGTRGQSGLRSNCSFEEGRRLQSKLRIWVDGVRSGQARLYEDVAGKCI